MGNPSNEEIIGRTLTASNDAVGRYPALSTPPSPPLFRVAKDFGMQGWKSEPPRSHMRGSPRGVPLRVGPLCTRDLGTGALRILPATQISIRIRCCAASMAQMETSGWSLLAFQYLHLTRFVDFQVLVAISLADKIVLSWSFVGSYWREDSQILAIHQCLI